MNAPAELVHRRSSVDDLDGRIMQVEQRLIAREECLRLGIDAAALRVRVAARPWRRALPVIGLLLGASFLVGLWRRRRPQAPATALPDRRHHGGADDARRGAGFRWAHLVATGWTLLPATWRSRISPAAASTLVATALPLLAWLRHRREPIARQPGA
jgi:hypothetical protein